MSEHHIPTIDPSAQYQKFRRMLADDVEQLGIRQVARLAGVTPMRVQRFVTNQGADDALSLFIIAGALGYHFSMKPGPTVGNHVEIALSKFRLGKRPR